MESTHPIKGQRRKPIECIVQFTFQRAHVYFYLCICDGRMETKYFDTIKDQRNIFGRKLKRIAKKSFVKKAGV